MKVSIKDIADSLNLSKATVSWILSGQGAKRGFSEATINRVKQYAESINYRPNLLARSLSIGTTNTIGLVIPFIDDTFYAQMIQAIELEATKSRYALIVCSSEGDSNKELELIRMLKSKQVDGIIIAPTKGSQENILALMKESIPFVLIDRYFPEVKTNFVIVDNEEGSYHVVNHLIQKGRKKIALITTDTHLFVMNLRTKGYRKALADAKYCNDQRIEINIDRQNYKSDIILKLDKLFSEVSDIDGFFFSTHYLALESLRYFINKNINYHKSFLMACFHDMITLDILAPEMNISYMPIESMGEKAVQILIENVKNETNDYQCIIMNNTYSLY